MTMLFRLLNPLKVHEQYGSKLQKLIGDSGHERHNTINIKTSPSNMVMSAT